MNVFWVFAITLVCSFCLVAVLRRYALLKGVMDTPNARSSHTVPTPRGGGVAIVVVFMAMLVILSVSGGLQDHHGLWALLGSGGLVAVVGFLDDHQHIAARWRLGGHFAAALWAMALLGGIPPLLDGMWMQIPGAIWWLFGAVYLVWMLNLYNFMDGIDGIASIEAACVCFGACVLYYVDGHFELMLYPILLGAAVLGFLLWNWPPAKIFMGDAGSGFLGMTLGVLSLHAAWYNPSYFWGWVILLGVFIVDATFTLLHRLYRGEKIYEAHRSHAYQFASRQAGSHLPVSIAVGGITLGWLLPWALCVVLLDWNKLLIAAAAYLPLIALAIKFRAGSAE